MSALDSFLDLSADQLAAAGSRISRASSSSATAPAAAAGAGFERYGLEHPVSAAEGGEEDGDEPGLQQAAAKVRHQAYFEHFNQLNQPPARAP
jgi:hypothetical protein